MRKYYCDRCKIEVSRPELLHEVKVPDVVTETGYRSKTIELCSECITWVTNMEKKYRIEEVKNRFKFYNSILPELVNEVKDNEMRKL